MRTVAIIQARMGSTRLPGKVMKPLGDRTVLAQVIARVQACDRVDAIVVATTNLPADAVIVQEAEHCGVNWFRGSETDVLERYYRAAQQFQAEVVVRVTSDCPLFDPEILGQMLRQFHAQAEQGCGVDYFSNVLRRSYPIGLDTEIFQFQALETAFREAHQSYEREHVTPYLYQHPERFQLQSQVYPEDLSFHRWTLDTLEDYQLITTIYEALWQTDRIFTTHEVLQFLAAHPELMQINAHVRQKQLTE